MNPSTAPRPSPVGLQTDSHFAPLDELISAVRRRLWRGEFVIAARRAAWLAVAWMLVATVLHLAGVGLSMTVLLWGFALVWLTALAWAAWRRPGDAACALYADRHLGGASAFGTLLELRQGGATRLELQAARHLEVWTAARVPVALSALATLGPTAQLVRPVLSMALCGALTAAVLALQAPVAGSRSAGPPVAAALGGGDSSASALAAASAPGVVRQVARALEAARESEAAADRSTGAGQSDPGGSDAARGNVPNSTTATAIAPASESGGRSQGPGATASAPAAATQTASGDGSGREAGDSPGAAFDELLDGRRSRVSADRPPGSVGTTIASRRNPFTGQMQADVDRLGNFDGGAPAPKASDPRSMAAFAATAATPPPASDALQFTPTQSSYIEAWIKAKGTAAR